MSSETLFLLFWAIAGFPAYLYVLSRLCSKAFFRSKIEYQVKFFREFDGTRRSTLGG